MKMSKREKLVKDYNSLATFEIANIVYGYHKRLQEKCGAPIKGHDTTGRHGVAETARTFHLSHGRASQYISMGKAIEEGRGESTK